MKYNFDKKEFFGIIDTEFQPRKNVGAFVKRLIRDGETFAMRETNYITVVIHNNIEYLYRSRSTNQTFPPNHLWLFQNVRREAEKFIENNPNWQPCTKQPVNATNYEYDDSYGNITGTDVSSAYWEIARREGIIGQKTYEKALDDSYKVTRLAALAVLGRKIVYRRFDGGKEITDITHQPLDGRYRDIYRHVRYRCYELMQEMQRLLGNDFEAYRTDCIYYRDTIENRQMIWGYLERLGYKFAQYEFESDEQADDN